MVGDVPGLAKEQNRVQQNAKTFLVNLKKKYWKLLIKFTLMKLRVNGEGSGGLG